MNRTDQPSRRKFVQHAAVGAAAVGTWGQFPRPAAANDAADAPAAKQPSKIGIGIRIHAGWLESTGDDDLRFLKQIGVDRADITLEMIKMYRETGSLTRTALHEVLDRLDAVGLRVERANSTASHYLNAHLGQPGGQQEIDHLKQIGELLAEAEIPVFGIQACQASQHVRDSRRGWSKEKGRGGYEYPAFDFERSQRLSPQPDYRVTPDQLWKGLVNIYRQVIPVVEGSPTRVAMHGLLQSLST